MIPLLEPCLGGNEARYLAECVRTNLVSSIGPFVERFERDFAATVGARHAVACASGTAALHVALRLAGAGPGGTVAVSTFTFVASVNAVHYTGADPLLVDSEPRTWNLDTELLHDDVVRRARLGRPLPAAVEVVHLLGHPAEIEPVLALRDRFGIRVVEDAAESLGAAYTAGPHADRQVGTLGDIGCFSFNGNKTITTGGGGMLVTDDAQLAARARHLSTQARLPGFGYVHDTVGYNYRLTNIAAALGVAQLEQLPRLLAAKRALADRYATMLAGLPVTPAPRAAWAAPSHWLYSILLREDRDRVLAALRAAGVGARPLWLPVHQQAPYAAADRIGGGVADGLSRRGLSLPSSPGLSIVDQGRTVSALSAALPDRATALQHRP
ncbi:MAG: DegT/DnrJ/EryC1/StrS family aminotransferase [Mycobacteriales bacterium]